MCVGDEVKQTSGGWAQMFGIERRAGASGSGGATYSYDGDGRRVEKVAGVVTTVFVYNVVGQMVAEYSSEAAVANGTQYLTADNLGTPRVITGADGAVKGRHDYFPFGEELFAGTGGRTTQQGYVGDNVRQGFVGYEHDDETGLDFAQARYFASAQGRFTSPDPLLSSGKPLQPQSWNRYSYVLNNPLKYVDPLGLIWGRKDGVDRYTWFDNEDAMNEAGYSAVTNFLYERDGSFYAVNPNANEWKSFDNAYDASRTYWGYTGLASSWQDWVPVWGQFRQMMFNITTENYEGAMGNFMMSSVDGGTLAAGAMGRGGAAAGSLVDDAARAVADDGMTTLYRAMSHAEFEQVMKTGTFQAGPNSLGGKWLAESAEHAAQWGQKLEGTSGFRIVDVRLPTVQADKLMRIERLDGIGPARYGELNQLRNATIGVVK